MALYHLALSFPNVDSFYGADFIVGVKRHSTRAFPKTEFVQIVNDGGNHWVAVSNLFCKEGELDVYDVVCSCVIGDAIILCSGTCLAGMRAQHLFCGHTHLQSASACMGANPAGCTYDQLAIRKSIKNVLLAGNLHHINSGERRCRLPKIIEMSFYCTCLTPYHEDDIMAECTSCSHWYHKDCHTIGEASSKKSQACSQGKTKK